MNSTHPQLGVRPNIVQFSLLVVVNAFVGAMVGIERSILPLIAETEFQIASHTAILSFIVSFGIVKAIGNVLAGKLADTLGRKKLLVAGWLAGLPVPFIIMWAPAWEWVVAANILLGINQGLCWSTAVIMKIDLAGPRQRGLAMGFNEFAGYLAVAGAAYWSATIAADLGLRPYPFYLGIGCAFIGLVLSVLFVRETHGFARAEAELVSSSPPSTPESEVSFVEIFRRVSWRNRNLFSVSQAGLVNNLNDGMAWGLLPIYFASLGLPLSQIGLLVGLYPMVWGMGQIITGPLSDRWGRKWMIVSGMWVQGIGICLTVIQADTVGHLWAMTLLGIGTAMVYPTLLAAVGDSSQPEWRASAVGVYRFWRDLGYATGAILSGLLADLFSLAYAILVPGVITILSGLLVAWQYRLR